MSKLYKYMKSKKNNKGFSLVELIVVILIIAIIAVALAPQVMKWVGTSKESVDISNAATLESSINAAVADYLSDGTNKIGTSTVTFKINGTDLAIADIKGAPVSAGALVNAINEVVGTGKYPKTKDDANGFDVTITTDGAVTVSCGAMANAKK